MNRRSLALLSIGAAVMAASAPSPTTVAASAFEPEISRRGRQRRPSKCERESGRGSRPCAPKTGNASADVTRRERAEAKRNRKATRNLASVDRGPADTGRTP